MGRKRGPAPGDPSRGVGRQLRRRGAGKRIWVWTAIAAGTLLNVISLLIWNLNYQHVPGLAGSSLGVPYFQDFLGLGLLLVVAGSGFLSTLPDARRGVCRGAQWGSALMVVFAARIMVLDPSEFFIRVTDWQEASGVLSWFTNADLLAVSASLFVLATYVGRRMGPRTPHVSL